MKPLMLNLISAALLIAAAQSFGQEKADNARAKLVGVWVGYAVKGKGENPERMGVKIELVITKDTIKGIGFKGGERVDLGEGTFQMKVDEAPFHLDGDSLRWCVGRKKRPTEFDGKDDAYLLILKRRVP